ncbi:MAG: hypothetical protein HY719_16670 [Planctomycetes bacterium]|nr:hypothetical protein [Planctomycetota bacterium]
MATPLPRFACRAAPARLAVAALLLALFSGCRVRGDARAAVDHTLPQEKPRRVAVLPFVVRDADVPQSVNEKDAGRQVAEIVGFEMLHWPRYQVLETDELFERLAALSVNRDAFFQEPEKQAAALGVDAFLKGDLRLHAPYHERLNPHEGAAVAFHARLVDATTGKEYWRADLVHQQAGIDLQQAAQHAAERLRVVVENQLATPSPADADAAGGKVVDFYPDQRR